MKASQNRVGPETENLFYESFWENLSVVLNALDNVNARLSEFEGVLEKTHAKENAYLSKPREYTFLMMILLLMNADNAQARDSFGSVLECLKSSTKNDEKHCITWVRLRF